MDTNLITPEYPLLERLPLTFDPAARFVQVDAGRLPYGQPDIASPRALFARPEGSFAARAFGNAVHECIELITNRIASGATVVSLRAELPAWSPRINALLRADGLPANAVTRYARETRAALEYMLRDPDGEWLLADRPDAASEFSLTVSGGNTQFTPVSVRVDRIFRAGPEPHRSGSNHLWIVDYKTASHSADTLDTFFTAQRAAYSAQLEAYARTLAPTQSLAPENIRLALYFPALKDAPRLHWWQPQT